MPRKQATCEIDHYSHEGVAITKIYARTGYWSYCWFINKPNNHGPVGVIVHDYDVTDLNELMDELDGDGGDSDYFFFTTLPDDELDYLPQKYRPEEVRKNPETIFYAGNPEGPVGQRGPVGRPGPVGPKGRGLCAICGEPESDTSMRDPREKPEEAYCDNCGKMAIPIYEFAIGKRTDSWTEKGITYTKENWFTHSCVPQRVKDKYRVGICAVCEEETDVHSMSPGPVKACHPCTQVLPLGLLDVMGGTQNEVSLQSEVYNVENCLEHPKVKTLREEARNLRNSSRPRRLCAVCRKPESSASQLHSHHPYCFSCGHYYMPAGIKEVLHGNLKHFSTGGVRYTRDNWTTYPRLASRMKKEPAPSAADHQKMVETQARSLMTPVLETIQITAQLPDGQTYQSPRPAGHWVETSVERWQPRECIVTDVDGDQIEVKDVFGFKGWLRFSDFLGQCWWKDMCEVLSKNYSPDPHGELYPAIREVKRFVELTPPVEIVPALSFGERQVLEDGQKHLDSARKYLEEGKNDWPEGDHPFTSGVKRENLRQTQFLDPVCPSKKPYDDSNWPK